MDDLRDYAIAMTIIIALAVSVWLLKRVQASPNRLRGARRGRGRTVRTALALVGNWHTEAAARAHLQRVLRRCSWPNGTLVYVHPSVAGACAAVHSRVFSISQLSHFPGSATMAVWHMDLCPNWDVVSSREAAFLSDDEVFSFSVPMRIRVMQRDAAQDIAPPPQLHLLDRGIGFVIPDFRCVVGKAGNVSRLALHWFPSFFAGLLMYPVRVVSMSDRLQGRPLVVDSTETHWRASISKEDSTTLVAAGVQGYPLHPWLWAALFSTRLKVALPPAGLGLDGAQHV